MHSAMYRGPVVHHRTGAHGEHRFERRLPWFSIDLEEYAALDRLRLFGVNRRAPTALYEADHGARDGSSWRSWLDGQLGLHGLPPAARYQAMCLPRFFGYVFNPITLVFGFDAAGQPHAVVYEVHSTFGDAHAYVHALQARDQKDPHGTGVVLPEQWFEHESVKQIHVSPFFSMRGRYRFRVCMPGARFGFGICYEDEDGGQLYAGFEGERRELSDRTLAALLLQAPLTALGVTFGIHWQALRLWLRRTPLYRKPEMQPRPDAVAAGFPLRRFPK